MGRKDDDVRFSEALKAIQWNVSGPGIPVETKPFTKEVAEEVGRLWAATAKSLGITYDDIWKHAVNVQPTGDDD